MTAEQLAPLGLRLFGAVFVAVLVALGPSGHSTAGEKSKKPENPKAKLTEKKTDLDQLRQRLSHLKKEFAASESAHSEVTDELREHERAISDLQRGLYELAKQAKTLQKTLDELKVQTSAAEMKLGDHQQNLEHLLRRHYINGTPDAIRLMLSGTNPNQVTRDLVYLTVIAATRQNLASETRSLVEVNKSLARDVENQANALKSLEARQREQQQKMLSKRLERKKMLSKLSNKLLAQRKEIKTLRRDEKRLSKLIDQLTKLMARQAKEKREAAKRAAASATKKSTAESAPTDQTAFSRLHGKLPPPSKGTLANRYGAKQESGERWKGLFFQAEAGAAVNAIADGQIVFADWLRGFGNLIVVDHGEGYLSVYGYNDALLKDVGSNVQEGDQIATTGNTGGRSETGLYFELRREGKPLDPSKWLKR